MKIFGKEMRIRTLNKVVSGYFQVKWVLPTYNNQISHLSSVEGAKLVTFLAKMCI